MTKLFLIITTLILSSVSISQGCFEIESILVDACGTPEGQNEMVRFRVGNNSLNSADINVTWPNNTFQGICEDATTANHVAYMNSTIISCGYFLEPVGGVLPAGAQVLFITSTDFDPTTHNYAGLSDTIYVIFQCAANTFGHFANWTSPCDIATGDRTLSIDIGLCNETVTYNKCELVNQTGGIGGTSAERDGARVDFDNLGNPSYANDGCTIPYIPAELNADFQTGTGTICQGGQQDVLATLNGNFSTYSWESNFGTFDNPGNIAATYTSSSSASHYIYFYGVNGCNDTLRDSLFIDILLPPDVIIQENIISTDCNPGSIELFATGATTYLWNTGETTSVITPNLTGQYIVVGTNSCGSDSDTIDVVFGAPPTCLIDLGDSYISCEESVVATALTNSGNIVWNTGDTTASITITESGYYSYTSTSNCGSCSDTVYVEFFDLNAFFTSNITEASLDEIFDFFNLTLAADQFAWYIDGEYITNSTNFSATFSEEGQHTITLEAINTSNGCSDTYSMIVTVIDDFTISIPNVITPNGDDSNDSFGFWVNKELRVNAFVLNRWGNVMEKTNFKSNNGAYSEIWDGNVDGEPATEGVYFYKIVINLPSGPQEYHGHFQLIR